MTEIHKLVEQECVKTSPKRVIFRFRTGSLQCAKKKKYTANNFKCNTWSIRLRWVS